jgi:hypothetical protein
MADPKTTIYRLNDLEVHEVSLVDKPANQRPFLIVKNADQSDDLLERAIAQGQAGQAQPGDLDKSTDDNGEPIAADADFGKDPDEIGKGKPKAPAHVSDDDSAVDASNAADKTPTEAAEKTSEAVDAAMADKASEDTSLMTELHPEVQSALAGGLEKAAARLNALAASVKAAKAFDQAAPQIPPKLLKEVVDIGASISSIGKAEDKEEEAEGDGLKKPKQPGKKPPQFGGKPEPEKEGEEGKPEGKKKPPFFKEGDKANKDKADELFKAVEKFSGLGMPGDAVQLMAMAAGKEAIRAAQDACYAGEYTEAAKYAYQGAMMFAKYGGPAGVEMAETLKADIEKAGRKISAANFAEFDKSVRQLLSLAEQYKPGYIAELAGVQKSAGDADDIIKQLVALVEKKDAELASFQGGGRPNTNSLSVGEVGEEKKVSWPLDMNSDYNDNSDLSFDT